jgi:hypothetical protein
MRKTRRKIQSLNAGNAKTAEARGGPTRELREKRRELPGMERAEKMALRC